MSDARVIGKTIKYGPQTWRLNPDGSWSALAFGSFGPNQVGLKYGWIHVDNEKVPEDVKAMGGVK